MRCDSPTETLRDEAKLPLKAIAFGAAKLIGEAAPKAIADQPVRLPTISLDKNRIILSGTYAHVTSVTRSIINDNNHYLIRKLLR
ncbi:MAG: hypothetical protein F6K26_03160 [Moorea sp. SIO2I5]|nr:hypothetical protein [Moorena sp. SIO2I5]